MADVRRLDGSKVELQSVSANAGVARVLAGLQKKNEEGRVRAIAAIAMGPEGYYIVDWHVPNEEGFPWAFAIQGALHRLSHEISLSATDAPKRPEPVPPEGDAS